MFQRITVVGTTVICLTLGLVGCGTQGGQSNTSMNNAGGSNNASKQSIMVNDGTGTKVALSKPATSFVCLDPSSIEMLKDLGETNIAYDNGDQSFVKMVFGSDAKKLKMIGGSWMQPNVEDIVANHPDLVIGDAYPHAQLKAALKGVAPMYLISRSGGYQQSMKDLINLGILTGHKATAEKEVNEFMGHLHSAVKESPAKPNISYHLGFIPN